MNREYHKWHSKHLNREMEMLVFGHGGAPCLVIPVQDGRFWDWEDRGMLKALSEHLENGWVQLFCVDSVDLESWDNNSIAPRDRAKRHLQYQDYVIQEVLPFMHAKNDNPFTMALGLSFGAYHSVNLALRFPEKFNRVVALSGIYDIRQWTQGYDDELVCLGNPFEYIRAIDDPKQLEEIKKIDWIITIGNGDPAYEENCKFSESMWKRDVWHAFRVWDGYAHDWPIWHEMILHYIGGAQTRA